MINTYSLIVLISLPEFGNNKLNAESKSAASLAVYVGVDIFFGESEETLVMGLL